MAPSSWLFIRGSECIRVVRLHGGALIVNGPGRARERHDFPDEAAVQAYQISLAERLTERGWVLYGVDADRRSGRDRRAASRDTPDRRRADLDEM